MKNRAWDRPGVVGLLFDVPGWPGGGYPLQNHQKTMKIPPKSMPCRPYPQGPTWMCPCPCGAELLAGIPAGLPQLTGRLPENLVQCPAVPATKGTVAVWAAGLLDKM